MKHLSASLFPVASITGVLGILLGAFGAHILKGQLTDVTLQWWRTAVFYHLIHTLLLVMIAFMSNRYHSRWLERSALAVVIGILLFSGSLYLMAITEAHWLGFITPVGGLGFILGWIFLSLSHRDIINSHE